MASGNGDSVQTRMRLAHALERLKSEPRSAERRTFNRRKRELAPWTGFVERRKSADRRQGDRRS